MLDNRLAHPLGHTGATGNGDTMLFALAGNDVDQIVIGQHIGEFEQRLGHLDDIIGQPDDHGAWRSLQWGQQLGDMHPRLDLDQRRQLAQHLVILSDLLIIAPV